jgi:hypothetical protein
MEHKQRFVVDSDYLKQLISEQSKKLVGKTLKRHEICGNPQILKQEVKELIYESYREFFDLIEAHNYGLDASVFKFTSTKSESKE